MKRLLLPIGLASLAITLALVAGNTLPHSALPVVLGVLAGIAASFPTSLIIIWRVSRGGSPAPQQQPPTVIVVPPAPPAAAAPAATPPRPQPGPAPMAPAYTLIGGQDET